MTMEGVSEPVSAAPALSIGQCSIAGRKEPNEDSYGVLIPDPPLLATKGIAMAIADGMSGSIAGKEASESCVKGYLTDYYATPESWTVKTSVHRVLSALNRWLYGQGLSERSAARGLVTTFSGLILKSTTAHVFHVGDSRIYQLRGGTLEPLTQDHRVRAPGDKTYLGRAIGIGLNVEIDYRTVLVEPGDVFLFTTDGVHEYLSDRDLFGLADTLGQDLDSAAHAIVHAALDAGSPDNLTCQIVRVDRLMPEDEDTYYQKLQELPFPPPLSEGMSIDGYRIVRELHASKRSQVYLAVDEPSGTRVVLKTPSVNYEDDPAYLELFTREEWVGKRINSPHVLKVREHTRPRRFLYYPTEYVEGPTLRQWIHDHPAPPLDQVRDIIGQIAAGLRAFHRKEMIHQDLKPENIVIDLDGTVKIIDFGATRIAGLEEVASPVGDTGPLGTIGYSAPEAVLGHRSTERSDIFALGVIAYEMLSGTLPYGEGFSSPRQIKKLDYVPLTRHLPDIPPWVDGAIERSVHKDPARRYQALSEFTTDLSRPNPAYVTPNARPLIDRDPAAFWRGVSLILMITILLGLWFRT